MNNIGLYVLCFGVVLCLNSCQKLDTQISVAACEAKCLDTVHHKESCRTYDCPCDDYTNYTKGFQLKSTVQLPKPKLLCKDENSISISWDGFSAGPLYYLVEARTNSSDWIFINKTICRSFTISALSDNTYYQFRLWGITPKGDLYRPSNSKWLKTNPLNYTPLTVEELNLTDWKLLNDSFTAVIKWKPAMDYACFYHFLFAWEEEMMNLMEREITNIDDLFQIEFENIPFQTNFTIALMSKSKDMRRESSQTWLWSVTPTCLQVHHNLIQCAPDEPQNLQAYEELLMTTDTSGAPTYDILVNWTKPVLLPDYYTIFIISNSTDLIENILGNETQAYFHAISVGAQYSVVLKAFSVGGESRAAAIMDRELKVNIIIAPNYIPIIAGGIAVVLFIIITPGVFYTRSRYKKSHTMNTNLQSHHPGEIAKDKYLATLNHGVDGYYKPELAKDQWCLNSDALTIEMMIGEGAFGIVYKGFFKESGGDLIPVAVKMLKGSSTVDEIRQFEQEIEIMKSVGTHPHLVSMLGCCLKSGYYGPLLIVEYCNKGDLQSFLRSVWHQITIQASKTNCDLIQMDHDFSNKMYELFDESILEAKDLLSFGRQIALGMEYLSNLRVVHRDLAARNILICGTRNIKIADFGLSRDVYEDNVYLKTGAGKLPVKWMAIESLTHQHYTTQSDVWSFGIVLWEIVTLGGNPYAAIHAKDLLGFLKSGYRMECPKNCSEDFYKIMLRCWKENAKERPTFSELRQILEKFLENENHYINLDVRF